MRFCLFLWARATHPKVWVIAFLAAHHSSGLIVVSPPLIIKYCLIHFLKSSGSASVLFSSRFKFAIVSIPEKMSIMLAPRHWFSIQRSILFFICIFIAPCIGSFSRKDIKNKMSFAISLNSISTPKPAAGFVSIYRFFHPLAFFIF